MIVDDGHGSKEDRRGQNRPSSQLNPKNLNLNLNLLVLQTWYKLAKGKRMSVVGAPPKEDVFSQENRIFLNFFYQVCYFKSSPVPSKPEQLDSSRPEPCDRPPSA